MKVGVMGTGGVGGYYGGMLARAGHEVACVARGAHLRALQTSGLIVRTQDSGEFTVPVKAVDDPAEVGSVDLVLFTVKSYDTASAARQMLPMIGPETVILSMQNGIENERRIAEVVGQDRVLGAVVYRSARIDAPGVIVEGGISGKLLFGEMRGGASPRVDRLRELFEAAELAVELRHNIQLDLWQKFIFIAGPGSISGLTRLPYGLVRAYPETLALCRGAMEEMATVAYASGVDLPGDTVDQQLGVLTNIIGPEVRSSLALDMERGKPIEVEAFNGAVCRIGRDLAVPTPLNFAIYAALKPYAEGPPTLW